MMFNPIEIVKIFESCPAIKKAVIFGTDNNDDVDVALYGNVDSEEFEKIADALGELPIRQKFDVVVYDFVNDEELREIIDNSGVVIYEQGNGQFLAAGVEGLPIWELVKS